MIDIFIIAMLFAALGYGYVLSRRLERLRSVLMELKPAFDGFSQAVDQSEKSIASMREVSDDLVRRDSGLSTSTTKTARSGPVHRKDALIENFWNRGKRGSA